MLRAIVLGYGLLSVLGAIALLFLVRSTPWLAVYLAVNGVVVVSAILFEHKQYHAQADRTRGTWQRTGERFVDPASGQLTEVLYNSATGEREYRAVPGPGNT